MSNHVESKQPSVLFVCTANRIRSPIAAILFRSMLHDRQRDWRQWRVESAGTWASQGQPVVTEAQLAMAERGFNISYHRSRPVSPELMRQFNLILTMETGQKEALLIENQDLSDRIFTLTEMAADAISIEDPIEKLPAEYNRTIDEIEYWLDQGFDRIISLATQEQQND